jgi:membrane protein DedA with SNARE-associated domain
MAGLVMDIISSTRYFGLVLLMFVENIFPPIPSEFIMPLAGYMVTQGKLSLLGVIIAGMVGSVLGALPLYYLGRKVGEERLKEFADRHGRWLTLSRGDLERAQQWFDRHGGAAVLFCRLVPGIRSLISSPAGVDGMNPASFLAYTAVGTALWTALLASLGYFLGESFGKVGEYLDPVSWVVLGGIVIIYFVRVVRHKGESATAKRAAT